MPIKTICGLSRAVAGQHTGRQSSEPAHGFGFRAEQRRPRVISAKSACDQRASAFDDTRPKTVARDCLQWHTFLIARPAPREYGPLVVVQSEPGPANSDCHFSPEPHKPPGYSRKFQHSATRTTTAVPRARPARRERRPDRIRNARGRGVTK